MISVCHKQNLDSLLAKSLEYNGELLMTMLQSIGTKSGDPVEFSIQRDNGEILGSCQFTIPEKSPIIDDNQLTIDLENTIKTCLEMWENKHRLLSALPKSEPSADGTTETLKFHVQCSQLIIVVITELCECKRPDGSTYHMICDGEGSCPTRL